MRAVWLSAPLLAGCMTGEIPHEDPSVVTRSEPCAALEGLTYRSVTQGECGPSSGDPTACHWSITFKPADDTRSRFEWGHSDGAEGGWVSCDGNMIQTPATSPDDVPLYDGMFDPANLDLIWNDTAYTLVP